MSKVTNFIMLVGLPASGKSTKAKELSIKYNAVIHSSDNLRKELYEDENIQEDNAKLFQILHSRIKDDLRNGKSVIYDATNINYKRRKAFLSELNKIDCFKICIIMATLYDDCITQNKLRDRKVPEYVIKNMYLNFHIPYWYEGWDDIQLEYKTFSKSIYPFPTKYMEEYKDFNQDNIHHDLTLGKHLEKTLEYICNNNGDLSLRIAACIHDCGKPFTKLFINSKGEPSEDAHYYQHQCVGSYDSLFYRTIDNPIDHSVLILWHMQPYFWERDIENGNKVCNKYKKLWGEELFNKIMLLHEADKQAH